MNVRKRVMGDFRRREIYGKKVIAPLFAMGLPLFV